MSDDRPHRQAWLVALSAGLGYMFDAYVVNIYSFVLPLIAAEFVLSSRAQGVIGSVMLTGYALGTYAFGWAADRLGRKPTLGASILVYGLTTAASGFAPNTATFGVLRFLTGIGGAGELAVGAPYTTEVWPARRRGVGVGGVIFSLFAVGGLIALGMAVAFAPGFGWRASFVLSLVPAVLVFVLRRAINESAPHLKARSEQADRPKGRVREILADPYLRRRLGVASLIFIANAVGYWGFLVFLQQYMLGEFKLSFRTALLLTMAFYGAMAVWPFVAGWVADRIGRRPAGIIGAVGLAVTSVLGFSTHSLALFAVAQLFGIGLLGWTWSVGMTYVSELFPTRVRATGFGLGVAIGRVPAILGPTVTGLLIGSAGLANVARWFAVLWVLYIAGFLLGPETRGRSLAEIDAGPHAERTSSAAA